MRLTMLFFLFDRMLTQRNRGWSLWIWVVIDWSRWSLQTFLACSFGSESGNGLHLIIEYYIVF